MSERRLWRWAAAMGVVALLVSNGFALFRDLKDCTAPPGWDAILAFEYARNGAATAQIIADETCRAAQVSALWYDGLGFIPSYGAFLVLTALAVGGKLRWPAVAAALIGCLCDEVEGLMLGSILAHLPGEPWHYAVLIPAVRIKFALLALCSLLIGGSLIRRRTWLIVPGAVAVAGSCFALACVVPDERAPFMTSGFLVAWVTLVPTNLIMAFRRDPR